MIDLQKNPDTIEGQSEQEIIDNIYAYAAKLLFEDKKSERETKEELIKLGIDKENSSSIVHKLLSSRQKVMDQALKKAATKNMLYGALWCIGGTIATMANIGYIFWGAILFGGIQFFIGVYEYMKTQ